MNAGLVRRRNDANLPSVVFSVRLDPDELRALETRAAARGIKPGVLARNLIRTGLAAPVGVDVSDVLDRVTAATDGLRALLT